MPRFPITKFTNGTAVAVRNMPKAAVRNIFQALVSPEYAILTPDTIKAAQERMKHVQRTKESTFPDISMKASTSSVAANAVAQKASNAIEAINKIRGIFS